MQHVFPVNDVKPHTFAGTSCECNPNIAIDQFGNHIIIHNAFDFRDFKEQLGNYQHHALKNVMEQKRR